MGWTESTHLTILEPRVTDYRLRDANFKQLKTNTSKREEISLFLFCANLIFLVQLFFVSSHSLANFLFLSRQLQLCNYNYN